MLALRHVLVILLLAIKIPVYAQLSKLEGCTCNVPLSIWKDSVYNKVDSIVNSVTRDSSKSRMKIIDPMNIPTPNIKLRQVTLQDHYLEYNASYITRIEGEYNYENIFQQTLTYSTTASILKNIPVRIMLNARKTNSPLFRDYLDFSIDLSRKQVSRVAQGKNAIKGGETNLNSAYQLKNLVNRKIQELESLYARLDERLNDTCINIYIHYKEILANKEFYLDSLNKRNGKSDSILDEANSYVKWYDDTRNQIDSFRTKLDDLGNSYKVVKKNFDKAILNTKTGLFPNELPNLLSKYGKYIKGIDSTERMPEHSILENFKKLSIGRSIPTGTQLSFQNITVKGINVEYQAKHYFYSFVVGLTDFGLRDFLFKSTKSKMNNFVYSAGVGIGNRDKQYLFFNVFGGKRSLEYSGTQIVPKNSPTIGLSIAGQVRIQSWIFNGEIAQSSYYKNIGSKKENSFSLTDRTNKGYSLSTTGYFPGFGFNFSAFYKYYGANYYGFNAYRINANNGIWGAEASKQFWQNALAIKIGVKKNDYQNPFVQQVYSGKNTTTTINVIFRKSRFTVSAGYIPSYQYVGIHDTVFESRYQIIIGLINYSYKTGEIPSSTSLIFNRFLNGNSTNQYFYGNSSNIALNQNFFFPIYSTSLNLSVFKNNLYTYVLCDGSVQYQLSKIVSIKGGFKINSLSSVAYEAKVGAYGGTSVNIPHVGMLTFRLDSNYYPDINYKLYSSIMGNLGFTTHFK